MAKNGMAKNIYATSGVKWPKMAWLLFSSVNMWEKMLHVFGNSKGNIIMPPAANYAGRDIQVHTQ